jgi:hypothetical protein
MGYHIEVSCKKTRTGFSDRATVYFDGPCHELHTKFPEGRNSWVNRPWEPYRYECAIADFCWKLGADGKFLAKLEQQGDIDKAVEFVQKSGLMEKYPGRG